MIQSIGVSSGVVVAGAIFIISAIYILKAKYPEMTVNFLQIFISASSVGAGDIDADIF